MGLRTNAVFIGLTAAFYSSLATALGLGEIKLHSALNQPLDAEIQLLHVRDLTEQEIVVELASVQDFERAGVEREFFLTSVDFDVDLEAQGGPVVKLRSENPVREPFLNFIVTAEWPSGKLLREYTLLVDLPMYAEEEPANVQATQRQTQPQRPASPSTPSTETTPPSRRSSTVSQPTSPRDSYDTDDYGPVGENENLWSIANRLRPDSSVSVQQTMLAIQRLNPEAFIDDNINLLREGQVLRVPNRNEIQTLTGRQAVQEVATQNQAWSSRGTRTDRSAQLDGSRRTVDEPKPSTPVEGRVKLSTAEDTDAADGVAAGDGDTGDSAVEAELSVTQEELDATRRENAELKSRIQAIEEQISTMERLVQVSNDELRALELAAEQVNESQTAGEDEAAGEDSLADDGEAQVESETPEGEVSAEGQDVEAAEESTEESTTAPPQATPDQQSTWLDWVKDNLLYIAGGAGALVALLAVYLFMRNREEEYDDFDDDELLASSEPFEFDSEEEPSEGGDAQEDDDYTRVFDEPDSPADAAGQESHIEPETEDVVGECDIHIAYGQYDQAEEKLAGALEKDPRNIAARMKLLEVFTVQGDIEGFDSHYAKLRAIADSETVDQAAAMREGIPDAPVFDESLHDTKSFLADLNGTESVSSASPASVADEAEYGESVDFDFDEMQSDDDSSLEFDLDFEDDTTVVPGVTSQETETKGDDVATSDELDEWDSELDDIDFELDSDDLEVGLDLDDENEEDKTRVKDASAETAESASDDLAVDFDELDVSLDDTGDVDQNFDDFDAQLDDTSSPSDLSGEEGVSDFGSEVDADLAAEKTESLDFDLDKDLEDAMASKDESKEESLTDLELNELEDLGTDLSDDDISAELDLTEDRSDQPAQKPAGSEDASFEGAGDDFDLDYDLEGDVNLDDLDQELGELDLEDGLQEPSGATEPMEEPEVDFDEEEVASTSDTESSVKQPEPSEETETTATAVDDLEIPDFDPENDDDSSLEFLSENDETATKLDLARAYIDMGDAEGAKDILDEIAEEGSDEQKQEAETLLSKLA